MKRFLINWLVITIACGIMCWLLPGIQAVGGNRFLAYAAFALFMALINASIKPVIQVLAIPVTVVSFGIAALLINIALFGLASMLALNVFGVGITISNFWWGALGAVILSVISGILNSVVSDLV